MPLIQVTAARDSLTTKSQHALMSRLSDAVLKAERASTDDPAAQSLVWAYFNELPAESIYVGGENLSQPPLRIAVTTPNGALDDQTRKTLVEDIGSIVDDTVGAFDGRLNHWAMLYELDEGSWAGGGQVFGLADIQAAMNIKAA